MSPADNPLLAAGRPSRKLAAVTPMHLLRAMCLVLGLLLALLAPGLAKAAPAAGPLGALQGTLGGGSAASLRDGRPAASRGLSAGDIGSEFGPVPLCECGLSFVKSGSVRRCIHGPCCRPGWLKPLSRRRKKRGSPGT